MPVYQINGYDVDFPHEAYECQLAYMEKVLSALDQSENALLESPTGTGKTLCLLCATLAWRQAFMKRNAAAAASNKPEAAENALALYDYKQQQAGIGAPRDPAAAQHKGPTIVYTSRTHSQLAQVTKELRNTNYKVRTTVLGSRNQLCLNEKVLKLPGQAGNFTCRALVQHKQCRWHTKHRQDKVLQELSSSAIPPAPIDIEELNKVGRHAEVCPYFLSRDLAGTADIIFMPYNYLVDSSSRSQLSQINWDNAVIIVDEAHNIQDACNSNASFDLTTDQLLSAISEMERAQEVVRDNISSGRAGEGMLMLQQQHNPAAAAAISGGDQNELLDKLDCGVKILSALYQKILELAQGIGQQAPGRNGGYGRGAGGNNSDDGIAQKGEGLLSMLAELDITRQSYSQHLQALLMDAVGVLTEQELASGRSMAAKAGVVAGGLSALISALDIAFASEAPLWMDNIRQVHGPPAHRGYRMYLHKTEVKGGGKKSNTVVPAGPSFTLSYWCFIPGVSMAALREMPLRSVLLTSGTLSPLESFAHELQLGFKYTLENPHVINPSQVWVGVVPSGPTGANLNSSFANRGSDKYRDDLGHAIANFARVVPDGLLVFFPAYSLLTACLDHWKASSGTAGGATIWERITRHKAPVIEPRDSGAFAAALADYAAKLEDPSGTGAVLFAVCRGKVSEGIDFSDKAGRGVVITGLPFPAAFDPHVKLQRQLLDEEARAGVKGVCGGKGLTGEQWYVQQGLRAVNQAMGRVIRHRWDYGAVLLADERFGSQQNLRNMSRWLRDQVVHHNSFGAAIASLTKFFKDKGDLSAAAAAAMASRSAAAGAAGMGQQAAPSAFQLIGGSSSGRAAAAARAATERQQRQQTLASVPRAIDVLGIVNHQQSLGGQDSQGDDDLAGSQLDSIISGIKPAAVAARSALLAGNKAGASGNAAAGGSGGRAGLPPLGFGGGATGSGSGGSSRFSRGGLVQLQYETDDQQRRQLQQGDGGAGGSWGLNSRLGQHQRKAAVEDVVGPAHLVQQHKQRQQQGEGQAGAADRKQQQSKVGSKQPLRMGQFLRSWNSTQQEEQQQQGQIAQQQQQVIQRQQQHNQKQQEGQTAPQQQGQRQQGAPTPPQQQQQQPSLPTDAQSFYKLLQEQLPEGKMSAVKELLTAYRSQRDLSAFADGLIAALGGSSQNQPGGGSSSSTGSESYRHLLAGFATLMPSKDQQWFRNLVASGVVITGQKRPSSSSVGAAANGNVPPPAAAAGGGSGLGGDRAVLCAGQSRSKHTTAAAGSGHDGGGSNPSKKQRLDSSTAPGASAAAATAGRSSQAGQPLPGKQLLQATAQQPQQQKVRPQVQLKPQHKQQQVQQKGPQQGASKLASSSRQTLPGSAAAAAGMAGASKPASSNRQPLPGSAATAAAGTAGVGGRASKLPPASAPAKPCQICKKTPMTSAHKSACGHMACYGCWLDLLATNLRGVTCPTCGKLVRKAQLAVVAFA